MTLATQPVLFVDCQTTGANPTAGDLLEISWFIAGANEEICSYLVKQPGQKAVPFRIKAITGISDDEMKEAIDMDEVRRLFQLSLNELPNPATCVAHFARFEHPFLRTLLCSADSDTSLPFDLLCTYEIARRLFPNLPSKGIRAVAGYFGTTCGEMKRARCHVEATRSIWEGLLQPLTEAGIKDVAQLQSWLLSEAAPKRTKFEYPLPKEKRLCLPDQPGVYRMISKSGAILYVGKATSLKSRVNSYFRGQKGKDSKTKELLSQVWDLDVTPCSTPLQAALLEADEIKKWDPPYNRVLKRRQRELVFYSPDFSQATTRQDDEHPVGPFPSAQVVQPILKLMESLATRSFTSDIFYYDVPKSLLYDGFELFCINEGVEPADLASPRSLLALGLWFYRRRKIEKKRLALLEEAKADEDEDEVLAKESTQEPDEPDDLYALTAQEVALKYERLLRHIARVYVRSKSLTGLLHAQLEYSHKGVLHSLRVENGSIIDAEPRQTREQSRSAPWRGLDVSTYDRMSVLLTELSRVGAQTALPTG
ncbi:MAG TPA: GIY-YIG nuclease family protein [Planktothrix sp.]